MGRAPCCEEQGLKKGAWSPEEDRILADYIYKHGHAHWRALPKLAGLKRCGKSCRLRWTNYLRPNIRRGPFTPEEEKTIIQLHGLIGTRWAEIARRLPPGRTDNEVKNLWNTQLRKRQKTAGCCLLGGHHMVQWERARVEAESRLSNHKSPAHDIFFRLWTSEVGRSFQNFNGASGMNMKTSSSSLQYLNSWDDDFMLENLLDFADRDVDEMLVEFDNHGEVCL